MFFKKSSMPLYDHDFYLNRHENTCYSASTILKIVEDYVGSISSAIDLGCGVGTWLYTLQNLGANNICGIDGNWVNKELLMIPSKSFIEHDFNKNATISIKDTFDLAISLEVAEHLTESSSESFIQLLTELSEVVLFSAAIPYQGGIGHINLRWPIYWIKLFEEREFIPLDIVRKKIWNDENIPYWYRQNILLFVKKSRIDTLVFELDISDHIPPEKYLISFQKAINPGVIRSAKEFAFSVKRKILKYL